MAIPNIRGIPTSRLYVAAPPHLPLRASISCIIGEAARSYEYAPERHAELLHASAVGNIEMMCERYAKVPESNPKYHSVG